MAIDETAYVQELQAARQRLLSRQLLLPGDTLSCRVPGSGAMLLVSGDATVSLRIALDGVVASAADLHRAVYQARPDAGAVLLGRQAWAAALPEAGGVLPGVFDEQLRHLGWRVRAMAATADPARLAAGLREGANACVLGAKVLCLGTGLERLVFNAELLEKCAKAYLLARATGMSVRKIPWLVRWIATGRLRRDQRRAARSHQRGEAAPRSAGY
ncbi:class II aldolase/adducin family protein [Roseateles violae]|uniref:Class II aldolase/adducin family protein n=1 Tax=Roseateles violae TaxID=3058042 RepID=A0ABT8DWJ7_9BURK|nr:class II aldolase/adducin family protein [Pelomonas sp. PFR6]MDN3922368.1 class II aldolase/adducin family protein [Pelomonas sp. PFR6]